MTHPAVREIYQRAGVEILPNPDDNVENEFYSSIVEGSEKTRIDQIIRRTVRSQGEYLLYNCTLIGENLNGNLRYLSKHEEGQYSMPIFERVFDPQTGKATPVAKVSRHETVYEIPYTPQAVKDILAKDEFGTDVGLTLDLGHVKYTIKDKTDFIELPTDQLMKKVEQYY
jgi:hypothetical protein